MADKGAIGFVGLGNMGFPMATNLAKAGFTPAVYDVDRSKSKAFADAVGGRAADGLGDLAAGCDVVVTMLPTGAIVREVVLDAEGGALAHGLAKGAVIADMSSSEPVGTRELGAALAGRGVALIDAPVSGGTRGAEAATLTIMIGGEDEAAIAKVRPAFEAMGRNLFRTGPLGSGHAVKALNNYVAAAGLAAASEAVVIGEKFGLDPEVVIDVINVSTGRNFTTEHAFKDQILSGAFAAGFSLGLMTKDVRIAADLADQIGIDAPLSAMMRGMWTDACDGLGGDKDFTAAYSFWRAAATRSGG